ncbi:hypothetical protein EBS43_11125 [bacterium]|nr:hypothetical protein [bacterium]
MRKYALVKKPSEIKMVILYDSGEGTYLFPCHSAEDIGAVGDEWYESFQVAEEVCQEKYGSISSDWIQIGDPLEHCQHDFIRPVRIRGRDKGTPQ